MFMGHNIQQYNRSHRENHTDLSGAFAILFDSESRYRCRAVLCVFCCVMINERTWGV